MNSKWRMSPSSPATTSNSGIQLATVANQRLGEGSFEDTAIPLSAAIGRTTRYLKLAVRKTPQAKRVLLGEIVLEGPETGPARPGYRMPPTPDAGQAGSRRCPAQRGRTVPLRLLCDGTPAGWKRPTRGDRHDQLLGPPGRESEGDHRRYARGPSSREWPTRISTPIRRARTRSSGSSSAAGRRLMPERAGQAVADPHL